MRFYDVDGLEMDVQDPKFYIDVEKYSADYEAIEEMLSYAPGKYEATSLKCISIEICNHA